MSLSKPQPLWNRNFVLLCFSTVFMFLSFYFLLPTLPEYLIKYLHIGESEVGLIIAFYSFAALIIRPFGGFALDKFGRKPVYLSAYILFALLFLFYDQIQVFFLFLLLRFLHGLSWGITTTSGVTSVVDVIPGKRRGEGIGFYGMSITLAMALGPFLGVEISERFGYSSMFNASILLAMLGMGCIVFVRYPKLNLKKGKLQIRDLISLNAIPVSISAFFSNLCYGGLISFIALFSKEKAISNTGYFFLSLSAGLALTRIIGGKIFDKKGPKGVVIVGFLLVILGNTGLSLLNGTFLFVAMAFTMGLGFGLVIPSFQVMVNQMEPVQRRGAANSTFLTSFDLGIGLGAVLCGFLVEHFGMLTAFLYNNLYLSLALFFMLVNGFKHYQKHRLE